MATESVLKPDLAHLTVLVNHSMCHGVYSWQDILFISIKIYNSNENIKYNLQHAEVRFPIDFQSLFNAPT